MYSAFRFRSDRRVIPQIPTRAFSLIELIVVLVIVAALVSIVSLSLSTHVERAALTRAFEQLRQADRQARQTARATQENISIVFAEHAAVILPDSKEFVMPQGITIEMTPDFSQQRSINIAANGASATYVFQLRHGARKAWFVGLGLSGQCLLLDRESAVYELFQ